MLTRRTTVKAALGSLAAFALPRGHVAAAIPADLDAPPVALLPAGVMPWEARLMIFGWVDEPERASTFVRMTVAVAADGAWSVAVLPQEVKDGDDPIHRLAGDGTESGGFVLSALLTAMLATGRYGDEASPMPAAG